METPAQERQRQGYPHSLLGLHALPASLVSPQAQELPGYDFQTASLSARTARLDDAEDEGADGNGNGDGEHQPLVETDSTEALRLYPDPDEGAEHEHEHEHEQPLPSLGYLDEALSFIAAERARWNAAREGPGSTSAAAADADATDSREVGGGTRSAGEVDTVEGGTSGKQALGMHLIFSSFFKVDFSIHPSIHPCLRRVTFSFCFHSLSLFFSNKPSVRIDRPKS